MSSLFEARPQEQIEPFITDVIRAERMATIYARIKTELRPKKYGSTKERAREMEEQLNKLHVAFTGEDTIQACIKIAARAIEGIEQYTP